MSKYHSQSRAKQSQIGYGVLVLALAFGAGCERARAEAREQHSHPVRVDTAASGEVVVEWNVAASDLAARLEGSKDPFPHLRTLTLMHLAMHDAVNAVRPEFGSYALTASDPVASPLVAAAAAAHAVLSEAYPGEQALLDAKLRRHTAGERDPRATERGLALGKAAARAVIATRAGDGANASEAYTPGTTPGRYRFVPPFDFVYRPAWRNMKPFGLAESNEFRSKPPPALDSAEYAESYREVASYGRASGSTRTEEQSFYADWWYELSEIGWNRVARVTWPEQPRRDLWFTARLFALLNAGLTDAYIAGWDSKLHYDFWRPETAIRAGATDRNAATAPDPGWKSYCVSPPVQDYPSTHSALGAAAAAILSGLYGRDVPFSMESTSTKPPGQKRSFTSFRSAALENADSRVACGIHFRFATRAGLELGERVGEKVLASLLPARSPSK